MEKESTLRPTEYTDDTPLAELTVTQFVHLVLNVQNNVQYRNAELEHEMTQKIFADIEGLLGASTPSRIKTKEDIDKLTNLLSTSLKIDTVDEVVVAVAFVSNAKKASYRGI